MVSWRFYMTDHALSSTPMNKMAVHILIAFIVYQSGWVHGTFLTLVRSTTFHSSFPPPFGNTSLQKKVTWCAVGTTAMDTSCCIHRCYYLAWRPTVGYHTHTGLWYGGCTEFYKSLAMLILIMFELGNKPVHHFQERSLDTSKDLPGLCSQL